MQQKLETTLAELVAIDSISSSADGCHEAIDFVASVLEPLDLFVHLEKNTPHPWFIATTQNTKAPDILLAAHLDVVPAPDELFFIRKENGKLYGRGVYDMKLAASCYLELFKAHLPELKQRNIGILFTTDEEIGGTSVATILDSGWRPKIVLIPDGGDNWHIERRAKGVYHVELQAFGKTAHGSRPWEGDNALHRLDDALQQLRRLYPSTVPTQPTLSVTVFESGTAINQIPDYAMAKLDFRAFSQDEITTYKHHLKTLKASHQLQITLVSEGAPTTFNPSAPNVASFLDTLKELRGEQAVQLTDSFGSSDSRYFAELGISSIIIEPTGGDRHGDNEWVQASELEEFYELIKRWVLKAPTNA